LCQPEAEGTAPLGLTRRDKAAHPVQAQRQTRLKREGRFAPRPAVAIPQAAAEGQPPIPTDPETEEHLFEVGATLWALPLRRVGSL
jgi:hypothetical protein